LVETLGRLARDRGIAVLMTTHDARLATFADRVVLLRDGQVLDQGTGPDIELRSIEVQS
jgi:putative ABC transport system ATP-binding protein